MSVLNESARELPRYRCTKEVGALKINKIVFDATLAQREGRGTDGSATLYPEEKGYAPFAVTREWLERHQPKAGGYWVLSADATVNSFSDSISFEASYETCKLPRG